MNKGGKLEGNKAEDLNAWPINLPAFQPSTLKLCSD